MDFLWPTFGSLDAGVLVVTQEESLSAAALVAAHHVYTNLLTPTVALGALVHICWVKDTENNEKQWNYILGQTTCGEINESDGNKSSFIL